MKLNENGIWINENNEPVKWWNPNEGNIIGPYIAFLGTKWPKFQKLEFSDGLVISVEFLGYGDSDNDLEIDDPNYEECYEFYYKILKIIKKGANNKFKKGKEIYLNYKDFPIKWEELDSQPK